MLDKWTELVKLCLDNGLHAPVLRKKMWCYVAEIPHTYCACHYDHDEAISLLIEWVEAHVKSA